MASTSPQPGARSAAPQQTMSRAERRSERVGLHHLRSAQAIRDAVPSCKVLPNDGPRSTEATVVRKTQERFDAEATYRVALFQAPDQNPWGQS